MKVLTAAEMREVDRRTEEAGIPGIILMENAAHRVVELLAREFAPVSEQRIVVLCGKGNNGGDGMAIARQLHTMYDPRSLDVVLFAAPEDLKGDAAANYRMLGVRGVPVARGIPDTARYGTLVIDALLGTGITGPATGRILEAIREINQGFPLAKVVAVDIPSGMPSDSPHPAGEFARADYTVTFTSPKPAHVLPPNCDHVGKLTVGAIGSPASFFADARLEVLQPEMFRKALEPRPRSGHKGTFGHALIIGGSDGKTGAAAMAGMAALRAGAGLVTVASQNSALPPELMSGRLEDAPALCPGKTVIAIGPGLGRTAESGALVARILEQCEQPVVIDADALVTAALSPGSRVRILTPHPGEMSRLTGRDTAELQRDRVGCARDFATKQQVTVVLKGQRTVIGFPDGRVWINPTGTSALGTGGTGDILTGLIAGLLAQFPNDPGAATAAAVYLHGLAGELGARALGEKSLIASDLLTYFPQALEACAHLPQRV